METTKTVKTEKGECKISPTEYSRLQRFAYIHKNLLPTAKVMAEQFKVSEPLIKHIINGVRRDTLGLLEWCETEINNQLAELENSSDKGTKSKERAKKTNTRKKN